MATKKICELCGKEYEASSNGTKFCLNCRKEGERIRRQRHYEKIKVFGVAPSQRTCLVCGSRFTAKSPNQKYCSEICASEAQRIKYFADVGGTWVPLTEKEREKAAEREWRKNYQRVPKDPKHFDKALAECREQGISYAERQMRNTLKMIEERKSNESNY